MTTNADSHSTKCPLCWKAEEQCSCPELKTFSTKTQILILQHPQESRNPKGTAQLASLVLTNSFHRVGLSWPSLGSALGRKVEPLRWGVLYLGTKAETEPLPKSPFFATKKDPVEGIVVLDGNWRQAKALWWRNRWLGRLNRIVLTPEKPSRYNQVAREPRPYCLSTIESIAQCLCHLESDGECAEYLSEQLESHMDRLTGHKAHQGAYHLLLSAAKSHL